VLSAVTPVVIKLQLRDLGASGTVVGRLSAWATAGALAGTFGTGFVLVPLLPVRFSVLGIGVLLLLTALAVAARMRALRTAALATAAIGALVLGLAAVGTGSRCTTESVYHCARVEAGDARPGGRALLLDDLRHSYVDLGEPRHLELAYTRWMGDAIDSMRPARAPLRAIFLGGGGFTLPRYVNATRPGSLARVFEVDPKVVELARRELGLRTGPALRCGSAMRACGCARSRTTRRTSWSATRSAAGRSRGTSPRRSSRATSAGCCVPTASTCSTSSTAAGWSSCARRPPLCSRASPTSRSSPGRDPRTGGRVPATRC
jgi:hypothetical protein